MRRDGRIASSDATFETPVEEYDRRGYGHYRGLPIRAVGQLHRVVFERVLKLGLPEGSSVLDLGAGSGAFSMRLADHGFVVDAVDIAPIKLERENITVHQLDLNDDFSGPLAKKKFDLIVSMELIEHIENPFHLFRQSSRLVKDNGFMIVTSPNMESWMSRLMFLANGSMPWFGERGWRANHHAVPHFSWQMPIMAREAGFKLLDISQTDNRFMLAAGPKGIAATLGKYICMYAVRPLMAGYKNGDINIYCYQKLA
jgi:SAM-dependent methyltransferase